MKNAVGCGRSQEPPCRALPALALSLPPAGLFDGEGRPCVVRMELPLSAGEMVAALYGEHERPAPADLETDGDVWGQIAMVVVQDGLHEVWELADVIGAQEPCHALAAPGWLALCRKRAAEVAAGKPGAPLAWVRPGSDQGRRPGGGFGQRG